MSQIYFCLTCLKKVKFHWLLGNGGAIRKPSDSHRKTLDFQGFGGGLHIRNFGFIPKFRSLKIGGQRCPMITQHPCPMGVSPLVHQQAPGGDFTFTGEEGGAPVASLMVNSAHT
ncbi:MAG TPA: hypothetical protein VJT71_02110 [Pyrinomonadaceae bacterium]|nr:hypothetical protein [Pyrinomonadaceae bacterium]